MNAVAVGIALNAGLAISDAELLVARVTDAMRAPVNVPSDAEIISLAYDCNAMPETMTDAGLKRFARALLAKSAAAQPAAQAVPNDIGPHDLRTSDGGRAYVAEFFAKRLQRHDFARYIKQTLAADFACALAQHLASPTPPAGEGQAPVGWLRNERGDATGPATLDPLFLLGASPPPSYLKATYSPVYAHPTPQHAQHGALINEGTIASTEQDAQDMDAFMPPLPDHPFPPGCHTVRRAMTDYGRTCWKAGRVHGRGDTVPAAPQLSAQCNAMFITPTPEQKAALRVALASIKTGSGQLVPAPIEPFQARVMPWMEKCFGIKIAADQSERNHRFFEEATELVQSLGMTSSEAHQLVDYTFNRPAGAPSQEVGGVMVTLAALCLAAGMDMHDAGEVELERINEPETIAKIRAKQAAKPKHSPLPEAQPAQDELETDKPYRVGWFWSSANPLKQVRVLAEGDEIARYEQRDDFISWCAALSTPPMDALNLHHYGDVLRPFVQMMSNELLANRTKGDRPGWLSAHPKDLLLEVYYHAGKLQKAMNDKDLLGVREYAADVANLSMMVVDRTVGLGPVRQTGGEQS